MLRTNLSTRPFYNERAVYWVMALAGIAIAALTIFNVTRVMAYSREQARLDADIERDEARARGLTTQASRVRATIDQKALERVILAAREANAVIDERTFSWTELFNHLERTLPPDVMLTSVQPRVDPGSIRISLAVIGKEVENVDTFIEKLEETGAFSHVLATAEQVTETGMYQVMLIGDYKPTAPVPASKDRPAKDEDQPAKDEEGKGEAAPKKETGPKTTTPAPAGKSSAGEL